MYFRMLALLFLSFFVASSGGAYADETGKEHGHKTPHGGILREAEGMQVELLIDQSGQPKLYLFDKAMKPLERSNLEARLTVKEHNGAQHTRVLKFSKDAKEGPLFAGEPIKGVKDWDTAVVSVKFKDTWHHIRYSHH